MRLRDATDADARRLTDIYNQHIPAGTAEWTERLHTVDERLGWLDSRRNRGWPVVVAERDGVTVDGHARDRDGDGNDGDGAGGTPIVVGVASWGDFRDSSRREGFRLTVEHSVYVDTAAHGQGVGTALVGELVLRARREGLHAMIGAIDASNAGSIAFHERLGFVEVGRLPEVGRTFDVWRTLVLVQLLL